METFTYKFETLDPIKICFMGDYHLGVKGCDEDGLSKAFDVISKMKDVYIVGMGDYCEYREPSSDMYDYEISNHTIEEQLDILFNLFSKVEDRFLGLLIGNHEHKLIRKMTDNPIKRWCKDRSIPYLSHMAHLRIMFPNNEEYTFIVSHGSGGGRKYGSKINGLTDFISEHDVDCVVMGHNHSLVEWIKVELEYPDGVPKARYKSCGFSGSFYKTYQEGSSGYQEIKLYPPSPIGFLCADIDANLNRMNNGFALESKTRGLKLHTVPI